MCSGSCEDRHDGLLFRQCILQISCPRDRIEISYIYLIYVSATVLGNKMKTLRCPP